MPTVAVTAFFGFASAAGAVAPVAPATFAGPSTHSRYIVDLKVASPTSITIDITTPDNPRSQCPYEDFEFLDVTLVNGSFSATRWFLSKLQFAVAGSFTSPRTAHGTVTGPAACGADTFTLTIPPPALASDPCALLARAGTAKVLGGGKPVVVTEDTYSVGSGLGRCTETIGARRISLDVALFVGQLSPSPLGTGTPVPGLGPGATLYESKVAGGATHEIEVVFQRSNVWAALELEFAVPPGVITNAERNLAAVALKIYPSLA